MEYEEILDRAASNRSLFQVGTIELHEALANLTREVSRDGRTGMMYALCHELEYRAKKSAPSSPPGMTKSRKPRLSPIRPRGWNK